MTAVSYDINAAAPSQVSFKDLRQCIGIIKAGDAVDPDSAALEIPRAQVLAIASAGKVIVGVGAIKHRRPRYSIEIAERSGVPFDPNTSELGYVAVEAKNRGQRLSRRIVEELVSHHHGALFATTASERMKRTLAQAGFVQKGSEWEGRKKSTAFVLDQREVVPVIRTPDMLIQSQKSEFEAKKIKHSSRQIQAKSGKVRNSGATRIEAATECKYWKHRSAIRLVGGMERV